MELTKKIQCECKICVKNAKELGMQTPLTAWVRQDYPKGSEHGLVWLAYHPVLSKTQKSVVIAG